MRPLTPDDLLPLSEYAARRREFAEAHLSYCDQYRRVRIGPDVVLTFENRQTVWFRAQELLRVMTVSNPDWVRRELERCNRLLPRKGHLLAGVSRSIPRPEGTAMDADGLALIIGSKRISPRLIPCRPEDRALGLDHWLYFAVPAAQRAALIDFDTPVWFELKGGGECRASGPLADDVRQSLFDDLAMSERDAA